MVIPISLGLLPLGFAPIPQNTKGNCSHSAPERLAALHSEYIELCRNAPQKISEGDDGDKEILIRYWCGNKRLHGLIWNQYRELIPSEVIDGILARTEGNLEKRDAYVAALEKREKLYAAYNERYFRQYRPARI